MGMEMEYARPSKLPSGSLIAIAPWIRASNRPQRTLPHTSRSSIGTETGKWPDRTLKSSSFGTFSTPTASHDKNSSLTCLISYAWKGFEVNKTLGDLIFLVEGKWQKERESGELTFALFSWIFLIFYITSKQIVMFAEHYKNYWMSRPKDIANSSL